MTPVSIFGPNPSPMGSWCAVVVFRLHDDNESRRLLQRVNATERIFLSSTTVDDRFYLRMNPTSHRTHAPDVHEALAIIRRFAESVVPP